MNKYLLLFSFLLPITIFSQEDDQNCNDEIYHSRSYQNDYYLDILAIKDSFGTCNPIVFNVEPEIKNVGIIADQDRFVKRFNEDRNYTMGLGIKLTGYGTNKWWYLTPSIQHYLDKLIFISVLGKSKYWTNFEVKDYRIMLGASAFTPEDIGNTEINLKDRPYASILYLQGGRTYLLDFNKNKNRFAFNTNLSLGVLGLNIAEFIQTAIHSGMRVHDTTARPNPLGWKYQISSGGALSILYDFDMIYNLRKFSSRTNNSPSNYIKKIPPFSTYTNIISGASFGIYNYLRLGISSKFGNYRGKFYDSNNELTGGSHVEYQNSSSNFPKDVKSELSRSKGQPYSNVSNFQWSLFYEITLNIWAYNAMIQGWYGKNDYGYNYKNIQPITFTGSVGGTLKFNHFGIKGSINMRSNELRNLAYNRNHWWGQLGLYYDLTN